MYVPKHFHEDRPEVLHALMDGHPLATLVVADGAGFEVSPVPLMRVADGSPLGLLRGHVSRANPLWRLAASGVPAVALFAGPQAYVSPRWYPSKEEDARVVPTWNYVVVNAHGPLHVIDDAEWLRAFVTMLTDRHEAGREQPWRVSDAPPEYVTAQLRGIVGLELRIERLEGKRKLGQNRSQADRAGTVAGLMAEPGAEARALAAEVDAGAGTEGA